MTVSSQLGQGSTFTLFFPALDANSIPDNQLPGITSPPRGSETILLVEDSDSVRKLTRQILEKFGYNIMEASSATAAIDLVEKYPDSIELLLTDVVMPQSGGRQLAERLLRLRPNLKLLYMSGYTDDTIVRHGVLKSAAPFLQKPFTTEALACKVRQALDDSTAFDNR